MTEPRSALDDIDLDEYEDFESDDLVEVATEEDAALRDRNSYIGDLWGRHGYSDSVAGATSRADALLAAYNMVKSFVDTFSPPGERYRLAFDPDMSTAGTDLEGKVIAVTPAPIFDPTLTPQRVAVILTGMAAHEVSHPRYGRQTYAAVKKAFGPKRSPTALSNILDDARIERRFAADYPGYSDVFRPMLEYVAQRGVAKGGDVPPSMRDLVNLAGMAIRYNEWTQWPTEELRNERDWWLAWADKWSREDSPRRHVEAIREGLKRVAAAQQKIAVEEEAKARAQAAKAKRLIFEEGEIRVRDVVSQLHPIARKAIRLTAEGRSGEEVAATLGLNLSDTKLLIRTARRQMAAKAQISSIARRAYDGLREGVESAG